MNAAKLGSLTHTLAIRIYYHDTDAGGVVYYARYGAFFERGRTELLRHLDHSAMQLLSEHHLLLPVTQFSATYHQPAYYDDNLTLVTTLKNVTALKLRFTYQLYRQKDVSAAPTVLTTGETMHVAVNGTTLRPRRMPAAFVAQLQKTRS